MKNIVSFLGWCALLCTFGCTPAKYIYKTPTQHSQGLETATPEQVGLQRKYFVDMVNAIRKGQFKNIHSVLVLKNNKLILESYYRGYTAKTRHDLRSTTKSITSLLVGKAIEKGYIKDVNEPIDTFLPEYQALFRKMPAKRKIQVKHFLNMSGGLDCNDWNPRSPGHEDKMYRTSDWLHFLLKQKVKRPPGKRFAYCTGGVVALGAFIAAKAKQSIPEFAKKHLFGPMGIVDAQWQKTPKGRTDTGGHLWLRPRDMAKIGILVLNEGVWKGKRLIAKSWIKAIQKNHIKPPIPARVGYGYLWWKRVGKNQKTGKLLHILHTSGNGGQYIFIMPSIKMVVVFTGGNYNSPLMRQPYAIMAKYILRAQFAPKNAKSPSPSISQKADKK